MLHVEGRDGDRFVVDLGGVLIEGGGGLGAEVAVARIELECGDAIGAVGAGELHSSGDAFGGVISHCHDCNGGSGN